ncbi:hypothetical protein B0H14DRAFT_2835483 [Mycena olivaceomarginata]|nr:hypothetical protein B0H14DRAFT_2835483 [Mycena olivaceomarginata]
MSRPRNRSQTYNSFQTIGGGIGGNGGSSSAEGNGGDGGIGEAPTLNYDIISENFTMNFLMQDMQNSWPQTASIGLLPTSTPEFETGFEGVGHQFTGVARDFRHSMVSSLQSPLPVSNDESPSSGLHSSFDMGPLTSISLPTLGLGLPPSDLGDPLSLHQQSPNWPNPADFWAGPCPNYHSLGDSDQSMPVSEHSCVPADGPQSLDGYTRFGGLPYYFPANPLPSNGGPSITVNHHHREAGLHMLHRAVALEALYDAAESFPQPRCHPETRKDLLNNLYGWATDSHPDRSIMWLHGPAGAGKSAVMQTLCQRLQSAGRLGGSFFFKRGHPTRGNARMLFATLAYQLALYRPEFKGPISRSVERDPSVLGRNMDIQLWTLILEPSKSLLGDTASILLIDGLDECDGHDIQREILYLIGITGTNNPVRLRILIASRPEAHIRETLGEESFQGLVNFTNICQSFEDIRTYLPPEILKKLVYNSSGYFVYAATVIKFVDDEYSWPSKQLDIVVHNLIPLDSESPFATLDQLYMQILSRVPLRYRPTLCDILCVIIHYPGYLTARDIDVLLGLELDTVELIIRPLHSVLEVPALSQEQEPLAVHHASFRDFLKDETRSSSFNVGPAEDKAKLGQLILKALAYTYEDTQKNLADIGLYWDPDWIEYITFLPPSADLVPHIELINPDFVLQFGVAQYLRHVEKFQIWLKKIHPVPEVLIRRWEDYQFFHQYEDFLTQIVANLLKEHRKRVPESDRAEVLAPSLSTIYALHSRLAGEVHTIVAACQGLLAWFPDLLRIFHAGRRLTLDPRHLMKFYPNQLFQTYLVLDLSWDNILGCIWALQPLITHKSVFFHTLFLFLPALCWELDHLYPVAIRIGRGERPMTLWIMLNNQHGHGWGHHIRSCPQPNLELLQKLDQFVPPWDVFSEPPYLLEPVEFHDVIQWLKVSSHMLKLNSHNSEDIPQSST